MSDSVLGAEDRAVKQNKTKTNKIIKLIEEGEEK